MADKIYTVTYCRLYSGTFSCETKVTFDRYEAQKIFDDCVRDIADSTNQNFKNRVLDYIGESSMSWYNYLLDKRDFILIEEHAI